MGTLDTPFPVSKPPFDGSLITDVKEGAIDSAERGVHASEQDIWILKEVKSKSDF